MSTTINDLKEDIAYVRAVAARAEAATIPSIYVLWAVIGLCGFALADFATDPPVARAVLAGRGSGRVSHLGMAGLSRKS